MASISKLSNPSPASSLSSTFNPRASQPKCLIGFLTTTTNFSSKVSSSKLSIRSKSSLKGSLVVRCSQGDGNGNPAKRTYLHDLYEKEGQSPWYDNLCRPVTDLLPLIASGVRGVTSNPAIFQKAISTSNAYNDQFRELVQSGKDIESAYWELVVKDIQDASKLFESIYDQTDAGDGYVSVEVSPKLADDTQGTIEAAKWLHKVVGVPPHTSASASEGLNMEEGGEAGSAKPNPTVAQICEECKANPSKYKCPGCSIRSCSLPCVKAHKLRTGCTGKRNQTNFVPLSQIDNNQLLSDYNLLEEVKRVSESAQRLRNKLCRYNYYRLPDHLKSLRGAASSRRTKLLFLPSGMSKREKNQTRYDRRKKCISWTIEWRFHSTDVVLTDHEVNENTKFCSIIENHLKPGPWNHQLRLFCEEQLDCLRLFIRKYPKGARSPLCELDIRVPIRQQLTNLVILEYPVIYVFLPSQSLDFGVVKNATPSFCKPELKTYGRNDPSAGGVPFKEEEIEEDNSYPKVFDLMKRETSSSLPLISSRSRCEKAPDDSLTKTLPATVATDNDSHSDSNAKEQGLFEDMDFDFDQGLIDTYSNLIAEINPDDFLDLEGELTKEELEERNLSSVRKFLLADDDIEEGEILE